MIPYKNVTDFIIAGKLNIMGDDKVWTAHNSASKYQMFNNVPADLQSPFVVNVLCI